MIEKLMMTLCFMIIDVSPFSVWLIMIFQDISAALIEKATSVGKNMHWAISTLRLVILAAVSTNYGQPC